MKKLIFVLLTFCSVASADSFGWNTSYSDFYSSPSFLGHSQGTVVTSIDLDPQNMLNTSFRIAAREGRIGDVQKLLIRGAEIDTRSDSGETALMIASRNCLPKLVQLLISKNSNVNISDFEGRTALILASRESCEKVVSILVKVPGVKFDVLDQARKSAMDYARDNSILEVDGPAESIMRLIYEEKVRYHYGKKRPANGFTAKKTVS